MDENSKGWNDLPSNPPEPSADAPISPDDPTEVLHDVWGSTVDDTAVLDGPPLRESPPLIEPTAWPPPPPAVPGDGSTSAPSAPTAPASASVDTYASPERAPDPAARAHATAGDAGRTSGRSGMGLAALIGGLAGAILTLAVLFFTGNLGGDEPTAAPATTATTASTSTTAAQAAPVVVQPTDPVAAVAAAAVPSIVTVQIFDTPTATTATGSGSGVIFRADGHILTNNHVIDGAGLIRISLSNGDTYDATLVGSDPRTDIAVLDVDATGLPTTPFADIATVSIGDLAVAVGNPLGLEGGPSVTAGVVSAFDRQLQVDPFTGDILWGLLQTDAPITRGSSGGALLNADAALIGITTAIGLSDVGAEGLGFAVPVDLVASIADDLLSTGEVRHAFLGITGQPAFERTANGVDVPLGAEITSLTAGSAIGAAGAMVGDVITALNDETVSSMSLLVAELLRYRAGQEVVVTVLRDGQSVDLSLVLDVRTER